MLKFDRRIDVTSAAGLGERIELATTIVLPDPADLPPRPVVIFAAPGGGYSRQYYDLRFEGAENYSEVDFHAARGTICVMVDHVGVGESTIPALAEVNFEHLAGAYDSCVHQITQALRAGALHPDFPACDSLFLIGEGQSMGAAITMHMQGTHATFDAIALCGISALELTIPQPSPAETEALRRTFVDAAQGRPADLSRFDFAYAWHWEDVPEAIVREDMDSGNPFRSTAPYYGSTTVPSCATQIVYSDYFREQTTRIKVPILLAFGERDVSADPRAEPAAFPASLDISIFIVPQMAHMHNFSPARATLWERLHRWSRLLSQA